MAEAFENAHQARQTETQVRRVMGEIFEDLHASPLDAYTLARWADKWLARVKVELSSKTHGRYCEAIASVKRLAPELAGEALDRIDTEAVIAFRGKLAEVRSPSTVNQTLKVLKSCGKAAWEAGIVTDNPFARVKRVRAGDDVVQKEPFTAVQIQALLKVADDEWRGMILAGLYSGGQRLGDICTLTAGRVDLAAGVVRFMTDKTGRPMVVPVAPPWRKDLEQRVRGKAAGTALFPRANGRYLAAGSRPVDVSKGFRRLLHEIGLAPKVGPRVGAVKGRRQALPYSFHSFRHTATSWLKNAGVSDAVARDLVGHESVAVSRHYTHIDEKTKRAAMGLLLDVTG